MSTLLAILKFLPEVISLVKFLDKQISAGVKRHEIKVRTEAIYNAFDNPNRADAARELNDIFRK